MTAKIRAFGDGRSHLAIGQTGNLIPLGYNERLISSVDIEPERQTYTLAVSGATMTGNATDFIEIRNPPTSATIFRLRLVRVTGVAPGGGTVPIAVYRRGTTATGGTFVDLTPVSRDSDDNAVRKATARVFSVTPTAVGNGACVDAGRLNLQASATGAMDRLSLDTTWAGDKAHVLRPGEFWGIGTGITPTGVTGTTLPAGTALDFLVVWTEETLGT
jgi:hypothetical protein